MGFLLKTKQLYCIHFIYCPKASLLAPEKDKKNFACFREIFGDISILSSFRWSHRDWFSSFQAGQLLWALAGGKPSDPWRHMGSRKTLYSRYMCICIYTCIIYIYIYMYIYVH